MGFFDALLAGAGNGLANYRQGQAQTRQYLQKQDEDREEKLRRRILDQAMIDLREAQTEKARQGPERYDPATDIPTQRADYMQKHGLARDPDATTTFDPETDVPTQRRRYQVQHGLVAPPGAGGDSDTKDADRSAADARADDSAMLLVNAYGGIEGGGVEKAMQAQSKYIQNSPTSNDAKRLYAALVRLQKQQFTKTNPLGGSGVDAALDKIMPIKKQ